MYKKNDLATCTSWIVGGVLGTILYFCIKRPYLLLMDPLVKNILKPDYISTWHPNHILVDHLATTKNVDVFETSVFVKKKTVIFSH